VNEENAVCEKSRRSYERRSEEHTPDMFFSEASTLKFLRKSCLSQATNKGTPDGKCLQSPEWSEAKDDSGKIRIECTFSAPELLLQKTFVAWHESLNFCSKERYRTVLQAATAAWLNSRAEATETECERARTDRSIARVFARRCLLLDRGDALIFGLLSWVAHDCHRQWQLLRSSHRRSSGRAWAAALRSPLAGMTHGLRVIHR
jgi:hypothetical protein